MANLPSIREALQIDIGWIRQCARRRPSTRRARRPDGNVLAQRDTQVLVLAVQWTGRFAAQRVRVQYGGSSIAYLYADSSGRHAVK